MSPRPDKSGFKATGAWGIGLSMCYKHVAPLGLNTTLLRAWVNTHHPSCPALINRDSKQLERKLKAPNLNRKPLGFNTSNLRYFKQLLQSSLGGGLICFTGFTVRTPP